MNSSFKISNSATHNTVSRVLYTQATQNIIEQIRKRLLNQENLYLPLEETLTLLQELSEFELGRFLLHNRALNGYWTAYVFRNANNDKKHPLEEWLLNKSLLSLARERFYRFKKIIQQLIKDNMCLASIPSGLMDDLLDLNYSKIKNVKLVGIDLDPESLKFAKKNAKDKALINYCDFIQRDAWDLKINKEYDLISSNGLNMYESHEMRLLNLYKNFYNALKCDGYLVISFLQLPPDGSNLNYTWEKNYNITLENLKKERAIFGDILNAKFLNFCTEETITSHLESAGFYVESIQYNNKGTLPILIARK
jgi:ubiquinone/menaquinone biosynthesis C-methylase UbiE